MGRYGVGAAGGGAGGAREGAGAVWEAIRIHRASCAVDSGRRNTYFTSTNSNYWQY